MTKKVIILALLANVYTYATPISDQDLDGVPDSMDRCPNTPFLNEVNLHGCTTTILILPDETESDSMTLTLGYGFSTNEDLSKREEQDTAKIQLSYYHNNWSYSLRTGHYAHNEGSGILDTSFKIKKRVELAKNLKLGLGVGIRLPSYDFVGNKTDYTLYSSLRYYPSSSYSIFSGYNHTFIKDEKIVTPLQDTNNFYIGAGEFFTPNFYANISYSYFESKFTNRHASKSLGSTIYYKINKKWFTTLSYRREFDDDLHDSLMLKVGYKLW